MFTTYKTVIDLGRACQIIKWYVISILIFGGPVALLLIFGGLAKMMIIPITLFAFCFPYYEIKKRLPMYIESYERQKELGESKCERKMREAYWYYTEKFIYRKYTKNLAFHLGAILYCIITITLMEFFIVDMWITGDPYAEALTIATYFWSIIQSYLESSLVESYTNWFDNMYDYICKGEFPFD